MANNQHKGAEVQQLGQFETVYRTQPGAAAALKLPFVSNGLARDLRRTEDNSIDNSPLGAKSGCGDAVVPPASIKAIFDARSCGWWLKSLLGQPIIAKAVMVQPVAVSGVTVHYAQSAAGAGNGTLTFTLIGTTLAWTPSGGTIGTAVNVGAGGRFTIPGGVANTGVVVTVEALGLPAGNVTEATINVHASYKAHVFPVTLDDRPSALLEVGHMKSGQQEFYRYLGYMTTKLSYDIVNREQNLDITGFAAVELSADTLPAVTTVWDGAPTQYDRVRFCGSGGTIRNGASSALGTITEGNIDMDNQATGLEVADGLEGYGHTDNGENMFGGKLKIAFRGIAAGNMWSLARTSTSSRLAISSSVPIGPLPTDIFSLKLDFPSVEFMPNPIEKTGKTGLFVQCDWKAHRNAAGTLPMIVLVNDVPSY